MVKKIAKIDVIRDVILGIPKDAVVVPRKQWGAKPALGQFKPLQHPIDVLWYIYNTETKQCSTPNECEKAIRAFQRRVLRTGKLADIPFNFMVGGDERIYEVRGWFQQPPDSKIFPDTNGRRLEIGYLGSVPRKKVTDLTESAAIDIVGMAYNKNYITLAYEWRHFERIGVPMRPESEHKESEVEEEQEAVSEDDCYNTDELEQFYRETYPNDILDEDGKVIGKRKEPARVQSHFSKYNNDQQSVEIETFK